MTKSNTQQLFNTVLLLLTTALPLLIIEGFGNSYSEPKYIALFCLTIFSTVFCFPHIVKFKKSVPTKLWSVGLISLIGLQLASLQSPFNQGLAWQAVGLSVSLLIIPLALQSSTIEIVAFSKTLLIVTAVLLIGALAMILFRVVIFLDYSPFGSAIGLKNSLSVFLAQTIPFLLLLSSGKSPQWLKRTAFCLITLCFWVIFASRTRSAWAMVGFYLIALGAFYYVDRESIRHILRNAITSSLLAIILLLLVPNSLVWRSTTPYWSSLSSMFSIDQASGRKELWQVALEIIHRHSLNGIGVGQYPALWKGYIQYSEIDPKIFSFLREDLPLFNDYLQQAVESGILASLIFTMLCLAFPLGILLQCLVKKHLQHTTICPLLVCCATAIDACFDYPFNRPETIMLYAVSMGFILRQIAPSKNILQNRVSQSLLASGLLITLVAVSNLTSKMYLGLSARKDWQETGNIASLETALRHWPWDIQWRYRPLEALIKKRGASSAHEYANIRMLAWPHDPFSHLLFAILAQQQKDFFTALKHYQRAIIQVENGNCFQQGLEHYKKLQQRLPKDSPRINIDC